MMICNGWDYVENHQTRWNKIIMQLLISYLLLRWLCMFWIFSMTASLPVLSIELTHYMYISSGFGFSPLAVTNKISWNQTSVLCSSCVVIPSYGKDANLILLLTEDFRACFFVVYDYLENSINLNGYSIEAISILMHHRFCMQTLIFNYMCTYICICTYFVCLSTACHSVIYISEQFNRYFKTLFYFIW